MPYSVFPAAFTMIVWTTTKLKMVGLEEHGLILRMHSAVDRNGEESSSFHESARETPAISPEAILRSLILSDYHPDTRPVKNELTQTLVNISVNVRQVVKLDEQNQIMTTSVLMYLRWNDEFLNWDPDQHSNISHLFFSPKEIWIPDIVLFNSVDRAFSQTFEQYLTTVHHNGTVQWVYADVVRTYCSVNITLFPFDYQSCALEIQSWSRVKYELIPLYVPVDRMDCNKMRAEWDIKDIRWSLQEVNNIPWIKLVLVIRRNSTFYLYHLIFPFFLLSCLTLFVFWLPSDSGEKVTLTITILLALTVFLQLISNYTPKASENLPIIGIYFNINLILVLVSVIMTILVLNVHFRGPKSSSVPGWVKRHVINGLGTYLGVHIPSSVRDQVVSKHGQTELSNSSSNNSKCDRTVATDSEKVQQLTTQLNNYTNALLNNPSNSPIKSLMINEVDQCRNLIRSIELNHHYRHHYHQDIIAMTSKSNENLNEWRTLAIIIDRICFFTYVLCLISSILFFVIKYTQLKN